MSSKEVKFGSDARLKIQEGLNIGADSVKVSLGPRGRNAVIERPGGTPLITKDGISILRSISLKDPLQNIGISLLKSAASTTNAQCGDGSTSVTVLTQAIYNEGLKLLASNYNPVLLKRGLDLGLAQVIPFITNLSRKVDSESILKSIATISTNNDAELGNMIGEVISNVGESGLVSIEDGTGFQTSISYSEGMQVMKGYTTPAFVTNLEKMSCEFEDCYVIMYDDKLSKTEDFMDIIVKIHKTGKPFLVIARDIDGDALATLILNREKIGLRSCAIKSPGFGDVRLEMLEDIAAVCGGKVFTNQNKRALRDAELEDLGIVRKVMVGRNSTVLIDGGGSREKIDARIALIKAQMTESSSFNDQKATMKERLSKLAGGAAIIRVGGATESEMREKKDRVEDAVNSVRSAVESGYLPGGGSALLQASKMISDYIVSQKDSNLLVEEIAGLNILKQALKEPFLQIMRNAGFEHYAAQEQILFNGGFSGYDALHGVFCPDMMLSGIIDPAKTVLKGIENAVSASSTLLTTEVAIFRDVSEEIYE